MIIIAQLLVLVIGHGHVVVCYDESGSSHIELVNEESCKAGQVDPCSQSIDTNDHIQWSHCSSSSCVDELFEVLVTLRSDRKSDLGVATDFQPHLPMNVIAGLELVESSRAIDCALVFEDEHELALRHRSIRTSVLVL